MKKLTVILGLGLLFLSLAAINLQLSPEVFADAKSEICQGIGAANNDSCGDANQLTNVIEVVINIFSIIVGIASVIMIMVSGFKYITASGDTSSITSAKQTLIYAIVGLVIVALSQSIVQFVLGKV